MLRGKNMVRHKTLRAGKLIMCLAVELCLLVLMSDAVQCAFRGGSLEQLPLASLMDHHSVLDVVVPPDIPNRTVREGLLIVRAANSLILKKVADTLRTVGVPASECQGVFIHLIVGLPTYLAGEKLFEVFRLLKSLPLHRLTDERLMELRVLDATHKFHEPFVQLCLLLFP